MISNSRPIFLWLGRLQDIPGRSRLSRACGALSLEGGNEAREEDTSIAQSCKIMTLRHSTLFKWGTHMRGVPVGHSACSQFGEEEMLNTFQKWLGGP